MTMRSTLALGLIVAALAMPVLSVSVGAQQPDAGVPPATVVQAGAALRDVTAVRETYVPQIAAAKNDGEKQALQQRAMDAAVKAINDNGLTVDRYNDVMRQAQADPSLGEQVLAAARAPR